MKTLLVLSAALASVLAIQEPKHAFFKDVPGAPREEAVEASSSGGLKIFNGDVAARTQFPYQAALFIDLSSFCGGSLIHEKWVLTAAHCVEGGNIWYVFLGVTESLAPRQIGRESFITRGGIRHPDYNSRLIINDIGVVQLMRPAFPSMYIQKIALTPPNSKYVGQTGTVSGFGREEDASQSPVSPVLHYAHLPVVSNQVCADRYGSETGAHPSVLCLAAEGASSCKGDSGGPFTVKDKMGNTIQVGAVSFGYARGCTLGWPVGYTNIAMFIDWLSDTTGIDFASQ